MLMIHQNPSCFCCKTLIGDYLAFEAPGFNVADFGLDIGENLYISDYTWIDSSVMMDDLNNYSDYKIFMTTTNLLTGYI